MIAPKNKKKYAHYYAYFATNLTTKKRVYFVLLSSSDISRKNYNQEYKQIIDLIKNYFYLHIERKNTALGFPKCGHF